MLKRLQKDYLPLEESWGYHWVDRPLQYYVRSTVLGGAVLSEVNHTGKKLKTYVNAGGQTIAWQALVHPEQGSSVEMLRFEHYDPAGMSRRMTIENGNATGVEGLESDAAEFDPAGQSIGLWDLYPELPPPFPGEGCIGCGNNGLAILDDNSQIYVDGRRISYYVDGVRYYGSDPFGFLKNGVSFIDFRSTTDRVMKAVGIRRYRLDTPSGVDDEQTIRVGSYAEWYEIDIFADKATDRRRLRGFDLYFLKARINQLLTPDCKAFIEQLIRTAHEMTVSAWNSADKSERKEMWEPDANRYFDLENIVDTVSYVGSAMANVSTVGGSISENNATVYLAGFTGFWDFLNSNNQRKFNITSREIAQNYLKFITDRAFVAIHELVHFSFHDVPLARAVAQMNGDMNSRFDFRDTTAASRYWNTELKKHCMPD